MMYCNQTCYSELLRKKFPAKIVFWQEKKFPFPFEPGYAFIPAHPVKPNHASYLKIASLPYSASLTEFSKLNPKISHMQAWKGGACRRQKGGGEETFNFASTLHEWNP